MKLYLKNFRCYAEQTFDFGTNGMALISGMSGVGKSTILMAINFALFGVGNKLPTHGKTSCLVTLEFEDIKITRTKRPNRVVVNDIYEDDAGQEIINNKFGENFAATGYIAQNGVNSFILMSPIEKLGFLERFAFKDVDLENIKIRCKAHIDRTKDELTAITSKLEMATKILDKQDKPKPVKFPIKCKPEQQEKIIKNENVGYKNSQILLKKENKNITQIQQEINDLKLLNATLSSKEELIKIINQKIYDNTNTLDSITILSDDKIKEHKNTLNYIISRREFTNIEKEYTKNKQKLEEIKTEELTKLKEKIENIKANLWSEYTKEEIKDQISTIKECIENLQKLNKIKSDLQKYTDPNINQIYISNLKQELENDSTTLETNKQLYDQYLKEKELYTCPSCNISLKLINNNLELANYNKVITNPGNKLSNLESEIKILKNNITKKQKLVTELETKLNKKLELEKELENIKESYDTDQDLDELKTDLDYLYSYNSEQINNEKKLKVLTDNYDSGQLSTTYNNFKKQVDELEKQYNTYLEKNNHPEITQNNIENLLTEEELRAIITENQMNKNKYDGLVKIIDELEYDKNKYNTIISKAKENHNSKYSSIKNIQDLETELEITNQKITEYTQKQDKHLENIKQIEEWERYTKEAEKYNDMVQNINTLQEQEKEIRNKYASAMVLKEKILESESIAMLNVIDSINTHSQYYLESFFPENPISVRLLPFKETKKTTKPQINIEIEYKGMEIDLNSLSGGELARVVLAFTLALAEMFNTPLLLLDECTASLDEQTTNVVFENIKEHFHGKLSLVIAHQVVSGAFDTIIKL